MMLIDLDRLGKFGMTANRRGLKRILFFALVATMTCLPEFVGATHLIGGDLRYRCLGNNQYEIRLTYRRDCLLGDPGTEFESFASIGFFNAQNNSPLMTIGINGHILLPFMPDDTVNQYLISDCTIAGNDVCVHQTTYIDTVLLPPFEPGYKMVYQRCCRNQTLMNVYDPLNTGMTLVAELSFMAQQVCNNSPVFGDYPPIYICVNKDVNFDFVATDIDGDSLVYELFTPFLGASDIFPKPQPPPKPPYTPITWNDPPYSLDDLLGGIPVKIDRFTGVITGTPNTIGQFLVGVKVYSYRNGVLIETTTREWQYNVRACRDVPVADFIVSTELNCESLLIDFSEQTVFADQFRWIFDYGNANSQTSTELDPSFTFPGPGFYDVALIVNDFDSICFDTAIATVGVFESELSADFSIDVPQCDETILVDVQDISSELDTNYDIVTWQYVLSAGVASDTSFLQNPQYMFDSSAQGLNLTLTVTSGNGCTATVDTSFDVNIIRIDFKNDTVGVCDGDSVLLFNGPGGQFTYTWSPTESLDLTNTANPIAFPGENTTYYVTVTDGLCEVYDSVVVAVQELPELAFATETDCRSLDLFLTNTGEGFNFIWDFGDGSPTSTEESPAHMYEDPGVYTVTLLSDDGCDISTSAEITVSVIDEEIEDESTSCFAEAVVLNPGGSSEYEYMWEPSEFLDDNTSNSPVAQVDVTTIFSVTITDPLLPGCSVVEEVEVVVPPDFDFGAPGDTAYCDGPAILLTGSNGDLDYNWYDTDGNLLGMGSEFLVAPQEETSYVVVGTDSFGCEKSDTITLSPTFFNYQVGAGPDSIICKGDSASIFVLNLDPSQQLSYLWAPSNLIVGGDPTVSNPIVVPESDQVFTVTITNDVLGCEATEQVLVSVSQFKLSYSAEELICRGETIELMVTNQDTTNLSFSWTPVASIKDGANTATPSVMPMETTTYTAHITNLDYGCEISSVSITVNVSWFDPDSLEVYVDKDTVVLGDDVFHLSTNQDPTLDFQWSGPGDISPNPNAPEITMTPTEEGTFVYSVTVTNADGCELIGQSQTLTVLNPECSEETVFIPDAFSPNGDGDNDELQVYGNFIESMELHIYNRWGEEVFKSFSQSDTWDGTFDGEELAPEVFGFYLRVVCTPNKPYFKKGNITLFK